MLSNFLCSCDSTAITTSSILCSSIISSSWSTLPSSGTLWILRGYYILVGAYKSLYFIAEHIRVVFYFLIYLGRFPIAAYDQGVVAYFPLQQVPLYFIQPQQPGYNEKRGMGKKKYQSVISKKYLKLSVSLEKATIPTSNAPIMEIIRLR